MAQFSSLGKLRQKIWKNTKDHRTFTLKNTLLTEWDRNVTEKKDSVQTTQDGPLSRRGGEPGS